MNKEEQQNTSSHRPIGILFIPQKIILPYNQKLKLQIAFYRGNKVCKTKPNKYVKKNSDNTTNLQQQKLNFCTTIGYNQSLQSFQSKKIDVQLAFDADGKRQQLQGRIDLKDILDFKVEFEKKSLIVSFKNQIKLIYNIQAKFSEGLPSLKLAPIKQQISKQEVKQKSAGKKGITFAPNIKETEKSDINKETYASISTPTNKSKSKSTREEIDSSQAEAERQKKINSLKTTIQNLEKKNEKLESRLKEIQQKYENKQMQINQLQNLNKKLLKQKKQLIGSKNDEKESEKLLQKKNMQIRKLQDQVSKYLVKQADFHKKTENLMKNQQQLRQKYQQSERKNVKLIEQISENGYLIEKLKKQVSNLNQKMQIMKKQHEQEISQLEKKLQEKQCDNPGSQGKDYEKLKKDLQKKDELIKILGQSKQNAKNEAKHEYDIIKKQNNELREELEQLKKSAKGGNSQDLQLKVSNEKLKRQFEQMKKMQKNMLVEKSALKTQNQSMQFELIKQKQTIAKMLNMIQQESQELFTMITDCIV